MLTNIGNGEQLSQEKIGLIESRFFTEKTEEQCPHGIRLAYLNEVVSAYNEIVLTRRGNPNHI